MKELYTSNNHLFIYNVIVSCLFEYPYCSVLMIYRKCRISAPPLPYNACYFFEWGHYSDIEFCKVGTLQKISYSKMQGTYLSKFRMKRGGGINRTFFLGSNWIILRGGYYYDGGTNTTFTEIDSDIYFIYFIFNFIILIIIIII